MTSKKELEKKLDYAKGYRDALVDTWENMIKLITKGYSSRELQIVSKTMAMDARERAEAQIAVLEADFGQEDIIDTDEAPKAPVIPPQRKVDSLRPGMSVMIREPRAARCYQVFEREISSGLKGLCVSRTSPSEIREAYEISDTQVIWLTNTEKVSMDLPPSALGFAGGAEDRDSANDEHMQPSNLPLLYTMILNFLDGNRGGVVLLEGLEYLTSHNNFPAVLSFFQKVNEDIKRTGSRFIVSVNHSAFELRQFSQLETEMGQVI